ncbi:hypothetical protein Psed_5757 [Pseudonocardia dioxanivorans CB1190]|uniref:Uncharacterized protein n=1 Tax=Pseudonocardia dioxanivorans (strain ATCC 55486 / DSM 44775 / JCM 13855 / CB1190) TaxID=675635 RepID=F4D196_PSEUX|nr:hypothetical protein [Pseudonocardia dioxanivorans]AEA27884.1 hypothetical protein Psed_5757 [Pseudonocardia dioxanivorans CB1190]
MTTSTAGPEQLNDQTDDSEQHSLLINGILGALDETQAAVDAAMAAAERARLIDLLLDAAYPASDDSATRPWHELPHVHLRTIADSAEHTGKPSVVEPLLESRRAMAGRILDALTPELAPEPDPDVPGEQPVSTDTLRRWAVWADQIAEHADARRRLATNGARHLADHIRREIAYPLNRPDLDPAGYRDPSIFDQDRQDPAAEETS